MHPPRQSGLEATSPLGPARCLIDLLDANERSWAFGPADSVGTDAKMQLAAVEALGE